MKKDIKAHQITRRLPDCRARTSNPYNKKICQGANLDQLDDVGVDQRLVLQNLALCSLGDLPHKQRK